jgi:hypothetical protein
MIHKGSKRVEKYTKGGKYSMLAPRGPNNLANKQLLSNIILGKGRRAGGRKKRPFFLYRGEMTAREFTCFCRKLKRHVRCHNSLMQCEFGTESAVKRTLVCKKNRIFVWRWSFYILGGFFPQKAWYRGHEILQGLRLSSYALEINSQPL